MEDILVVGDIAGEYDALMRLVARVPETTFIMALGDLVDRGPKSAEVVQWFVDNQHRADSLMGNHEHMMIDFVEQKGIYHPEVWVYNGGGTTIQSYRVGDNFLGIPASHLNYLSTRKKHRTFPGKDGTPDLFCSHAALNPCLTLDDVCEELPQNDPHFDDSIMWNRGKPRIWEGTFQVMGHNSHWGLTKFGPYDKPWGMCLDTTRKQILTGLRWPAKDWPEFEVIQEPYETLKSEEKE